VVFRGESKGPSVGIGVSPFHIRTLRFQALDTKDPANFLDSIGPQIGKIFSAEVSIGTFFEVRTLEDPFQILQFLIPSPAIKAKFPPILPDLVQVFRGEAKNHFPLLVNRQRSGICRSRSRSWSKGERPASNEGAEILESLDLSAA